MKKFFVFMMGCAKHFFDNAILTRAGSLAFTTIIALVPLVVLSLSILSFLPLSDVVRMHLQHFIFSNFLVNSAQVISNYVQIFVARAHTLSLISFAFLMVTAFTILFSLEDNLNIIWYTPRIRTWYQTLGLYLLVLLLGPLLLATSLLASFAVIQYMNHFLHGHAKWLLMVVPLLLSYCGFLLIYKILPNCRVPWRSASIGALTAALLFESAKIIFAWYLEAFPTYKIVYGAISALPILFIWIYICWVIFLFGALVSYMVGDKGGNT